MARLLYFAARPDEPGRGAAETKLPETVRDVHGLAARPRRCLGKNPLAEIAARVALNRQVAGLDAPGNDSREIGIIATRPDRRCCETYLIPDIHSISPCQAA